MVLGKFFANFRRKCIKVTDTRVRMMNEILTCVKLIKMYAWELSFAKAIGKYLKQGGATSALLWATFQNYSSLRASVG